MAVSRGAHGSTQTNSGGTETVTVSVTAGSTIVVACMGDSALLSATCADATNGSYGTPKINTVYYLIDGTNDAYLRVWVFENNAASGSLNVQVSGLSSGAATTIVEEVLGAATASYDTVNNANDATEPFSSGGITNALADEMLLAFWTTDSATTVGWSDAAGFTIGESRNGSASAWSGGSAYKVRSSVAADDCSISDSGSATHACVGLIGIKGTTSVEQEGFAFGDDDNNESTHTLGTQDTDFTGPADTAKTIRALLNYTGDSASITPTLMYQKNGTGGYGTVPVGASTTPSLSWGTNGSAAYSSSGGASVSPAYPSGITTNSELVLVIGQKPSSANGGSVTTPSGWTLRGSRTGANDGDTGGYGTTLGADTGNTNIYVYTKDTVTGSESGTLAVTVATNGVCWGIILRVQKSVSGTVSWASGTGKDTAAGSVSIATGSMDVASGDFVIGAMCIPTDVSTPSQFSAEAFAQSGTTFGSVAEATEPDSSTDNDIGGFICYASATAGSGSGAVTLSATAGGTTTNVRGPGFVLRARPVAVDNEVYVTTSANIAAGGEATTARLTAPSGKTSGSDFEAGRRWDDENGSDAIDPAANKYSEFEWKINTSSSAGAGTNDYYEFRVYNGATPLTVYTLTPKWTIGTPGGPVTDGNFLQFLMG